jgi:hypothetical protein
MEKKGKGRKKKEGIGRGNTYILKTYVIVLLATIFQSCEGKQSLSETHFILIIPHTMTQTTIFTAGGTVFTKLRGLNAYHLGEKLCKLGLKTMSQD